MNYGLKKPKLSFLKSLGLRCLCEKVSGDKLEPKADKCIFIEYPKTVGYTSYLEAKVIASRNQSFLEEKFLSKELSGRMVET